MWGRWPFHASPGFAGARSNAKRCEERSTNPAIRLAVPGSPATITRWRLAILLTAAGGTNDPPPPEPAAFRAPAPKPSAPAPPAPAANLVTARELFEHPEWIGTSRW